LLLSFKWHALYYLLLLFCLHLASQSIQAKLLFMNKLKHTHIIASREPLKCHDPIAVPLTPCAVSHSYAAVVHWCAAYVFAVVAVIL